MAVDVVLSGVVGLLLTWIVITLHGALTRDRTRYRAARSGYLLFFGVVCAFVSGMTLAGAAL